MTDTNDKTMTLKAAREILEPAAFDALALVAVARRLVDGMEGKTLDADADNLLSAPGRVAVLLRLADEQLRVGLRALGQVPG